MMNSLQGHFLVGSPHLADPNFYHSVVLMVQHDEEGALGLILNRPTKSTVGDIWRLIGKDELDCARPVFLGGPVQGPLMVVHSQLAYSQIQIAPGVHFATETDYVEAVVANVKKPWLLFSGYSGWGAGQLEREMRQGGWLTIEATDGDVFYEGEDLWERLIQRIGMEIITPAIPASRVPPDPSMN
jgi:putative transcriptional regulator